MEEKNLRSDEPRQAAEEQTNLAEVQRYMDVTGAHLNRIKGRIREPVLGNLKRLKEVFKSAGLVASFAKADQGHEIVYGESRTLKPPKRWVNLVLFLATILTTLFVGSFQMGHNPIENPFALLYGFPFSLSIILILGSHELGHYFAARRLGVDVTLPYFLPVPHPMTGTMGAFIKIRSPVPSKGALVKVGVAGPLVGFLVALPVTIIGLSLSRVVTADAAARGIQLGSPLVFWLLSRLVVGETPAGADLMLHPVAFAGWLGCFVTALNLLPVGQLDGGHIVYAVAGRFRKVLNWVVIGILVLMGFFWLGWPFWAILISVFGLRHPRPLDDITPLSRTEKILAAAGLVILILTFTPMPFGAIRV